jgi:hypothetical protein
MKGGFGEIGEVPCPGNPADREMGFVMPQSKSKDAAWANELQIATG